MSKKLLIKTWGCQMNEYDSSKMADLLNAANGYELTEEPEEADVLLLNTCSIREKAQEKVFHQLGRWKTLKDKKPGVVIGVGGCVATQEGDHIRQRAPYVDVIFGPQTLHRLPEMIKQSQSDEAPVMDISFPEIEKFDRLPEPRAEGATAFVSIMEGCSKYCTYCVVPYTRGEEVSRPMDDVLFEIAQLADQGVREVNLLGQNVNAYRGPMHDGEICSFAELLRLVASIDGIDRIRFTTSHPLEFTDDIIAVYEDTPELGNKGALLKLGFQRLSLCALGIKQALQARKLCITLALESCQFTLPFRDLFLQRLGLGIKGLAQVPNSGLDFRVAGRLTGRQCLTQLGQFVQYLLARLRGRGGRHIEGFFHRNQCVIDALVGFVWRELQAP